MESAESQAHIISPMPELRIRWLSNPGPRRCTGRRYPHRRSGYLRPRAAAAPPPPASPPLVVAPAGFLLPTPGEVATGHRPSLTDQAVTRPVPYNTTHLAQGGAGEVGPRGFPHVVRNGSPSRSVLGAAMVDSDSLHNAASPGPAGRSHWVLQCPARLSDRRLSVTTVPLKLTHARTHT